MKVLHFYRTYFPDTQGGLEEAIRQICASTTRCGVENRILTLSQNPHPMVMHFDEADVYRAQLNLDIASCSMGVEAFSMFRELEGWADVVHYHFPWPFADIVRLWAHSKKPSVLTYHSDIVRQLWLGRIYQPLMYWFLKSASHIVATSPNYAESSTVLKQFAEKLSIIPIGLNEASYPDVNQMLVQNFLEKYGKDFFLFIGVLREYKGLHVLLEAVKDAPFTLLVAGKGPQEVELKQQAMKLGLSNVHFLGYVSDEIKVALMSCCRGVVLPSNLRSEAFGVAMLEGAMMGRPLISADIGTGTSYVNIHGETGLVCEASNPRAMRDALDVLHQDEALAVRMGWAARKRFCSIFTAAIMGSEYIKVYSNLLGKVSSIG